ncbi:Putative acyltransferase [Mycobacteroides abscessus subsp. abscessus]|nr:Putative acyltransferase [Mycobacteroides abscessus subsp. abscessus]
MPHRLGGSAPTLAEAARWDAQDAAERKAQRAAREAEKQAQQAQKDGAQKES